MPVKITYKIGVVTLPNRKPFSTTLELEADFICYKSRNPSESEAIFNLWMWKPIKGVPRRNPSESEAIFNSTRKFPCNFTMLNGHFREPILIFSISGIFLPFFTLNGP